MSDWEKDLTDAVSHQNVAKQTKQRDEQESQRQFDENYNQARGAWKKVLVPALNAFIEKLQSLNRRVIPRRYSERAGGISAGFDVMGPDGLLMSVDLFTVVTAGNIQTACEGKYGDRHRKKWNEEIPGPIQDITREMILEELTKRYKLA